MRKPYYLRFRRVLKVTQGLLIIIWMILMIVAKLKGL